MAKHRVDDRDGATPTITIQRMENDRPYEVKLTNRDYETELRLLQIELLKMQKWVKESGNRLVLLFEGRDAAGKGGAIRRFTEHLNPRGARVVALAAPNETERGQWYFQRYVQHLPTAGEIVLFDRSWYNRAGVEHVMGFCTPHEYREFFRQVPAFERNITHSGVQLFKIWFTVSQREQLRRFEQREHDPLRQWKLSPMDVASLDKYAAYGKARDAMLVATDHDDGPWTIVNSNDKKRARLEAIRHVLASIDYEHKDHATARHADVRVVQPAAVAVRRAPSVTA
jgi:polyphosphate kinase 2